MKTNSRVLVCLLLIIGICAGCWDRRELGDLGVVQVLGFDQGKNQKDISISVMIAIPGKLGGSGQNGGNGGGNEPGVLVITQEAPSIYEAFNLINTKIEREISLAQTSLLILGEEFAKGGVSKWVDNLARFREMRRTMQLAVCRGKASDILKVQPKLEKNPSEYFLKLISLSPRTGMFPIASIHDFLYAYEARVQQVYLPFLSESKAEKEPPKEEKPAENGEAAKTPAEKPPPEEVRMIGTAVFNGDKMVGHLDIYETQMFLLLINRFREANMTINDPKREGYYVIFRLLASAPPQINYKHKNGRELFRVKMNLEADILSIQSGIDYTAPKQEVFLGKAIARELKKRIQKVIEKTQQQFNSDIFGFGIKVRNRMITAADWDKYQWPARFRDAEIIPQVKVTIRRVGVQYQPPDER